MRTIRIYDSDFDKLDAKADELGTDIDEVIRLLVDEHLDEVE